MMKDNERHNWSESDEKSLVSTIKWVEENISKTAIRDRGGKWGLVSGLLFTDIGLRVSDSSCRTRYSDIKKRLQKRVEGGTEVIKLVNRQKKKG